MEVNSFNGGFAEIESDEVIVLVNNAEIGSDIDIQNAEQDLKIAVNKFSDNEKIPRKLRPLKRFQRLRLEFRLQKTNF